MRGVILAVILAIPVNVGAQEGMWVPMSGAEIATALTERTLDYGAQWQDFRASGRTLYHNAGRDSWGYWAIQSNQYCSLWPPSDLWACYDMERAGERLRFIDETGSTTEALYKTKD